MSSQQLALDFGTPTRTPAIDILYFALLPDEEAATAALAIAEQDFADRAAVGFLYAPDRLHVSVDRRWSGRGLPDFAVEDALRQGSAVALAPFEIRLDRLQSSGNGTDRPRVLTTHVASSGFSTLVRQIGGLKSAVRAIPHMTLYRARAAAPEIPIPAPITFMARELVLIHARKGTGAWKILERWPLSAP